MLKVELIQKIKEIYDVLEYQLHYKEVYSNGEVDTGYYGGEKVENSVLDLKKLYNELYNEVIINEE